MTTKNEQRKANPSLYGRIPLPLLYRKDVSLQAKTLYALLDDYCGKKKTCFPSIDVLAADLGKSRGYIVKLTKELVAAKAISFVSNPPHVNVYTLLDMQPEAATSAPEPEVEPVIEQESLQPDLHQANLHVCDLVINYGKDSCPRSKYPDRPDAPCRSTSTPEVNGAWTQKIQLELMGVARQTLPKEVVAALYPDGVA